MKRRLFFLGWLLVLRLLINLVWASRYHLGREVTATSEINLVDQNQTECIVKVNSFWVKMAGKCQLRQGDRVKLSGRLEASLTDRFLGRIWLTEPVIQTSPLAPLLGKEGENHIQGPSLKPLREKLVAVGQRLLSEPEAGLVLGVVIGFKKGIASDFYNQMINSGTIHIIVASGYNVMVVGNLLMAFWLLWLRRSWATVVAITTMIFYGGLAGGEPPVIRAVVMGSVGLIGLALGRAANAVWALLLTLVLMMVIEPLLVENISFQLTASSSLGVFWLLPELERGLRSPLERHVFGQALMRTELLSTVAATAMTAPIIWWHFQRLSLIGLLSNILILPLVPVLMIWGGVALLINLFLPMTFLAWPVYGLAHTVVWLINFFGQP